MDGMNEGNDADNIDVSRPPISSNTRALDRSYLTDSPYYYPRTFAPIDLITMFYIQAAPLYSSPSHSLCSTLLSIEFPVVYRELLWCCLENIGGCDVVCYERHHTTRQPPLPWLLSSGSQPVTLYIREKERETIKSHQAIRSIISL